MKRILPLLLSLLLLTGCASNQPGQYPDGVPSSLTAVRWPEAPHAEDYDAQRSLRADVTPNSWKASTALPSTAPRSSWEIAPKRKTAFTPLSACTLPCPCWPPSPGGDTQAQILSALASDEAMLEHTGALYRFLYRDDEHAI